MRSSRSRGDGGESGMQQSAVNFISGQQKRISHERRNGIPGAHACARSRCSDHCEGAWTEFPGQAPRQERDLRHRRHRHGGLLGVLHVEARRSWRIGKPAGEGHGRSNCASLFGIAKIPSDNHIRDMLDPAEPALLRPVFAETIEQLRQIDGGLDLFRRLDGRAC